VRNKSEIGSMVMSRASSTVEALVADGVLINNIRSGSPKTTHEIKHRSNVLGVKAMVTWPLAVAVQEMERTFKEAEGTIRGRSTKAREVDIHLVAEVIIDHADMVIEDRATQSTL
jgi:predicted TIM-barrel enzyme